MTRFFCVLENVGREILFEFAAVVGVAKRIAGSQPRSGSTHNFHFSWNVACRQVSLVRASQ